MCVAGNEYGNDSRLVIRCSRSRRFLHGSAPVPGPSTSCSARLRLGSDGGGERRGKANLVGGCCSGWWPFGLLAPSAPLELPFGVRVPVNGYARGKSPLTAFFFTLCSPSVSTHTFSMCDLPLPLLLPPVTVSLLSSPPGRSLRQDKEAAPLVRAGGSSELPENEDSDPVFISLVPSNIEVPVVNIPVEDREHEPHLDRRWFVGLRI